MDLVVSLLLLSVIFFGPSAAALTEQILSTVIYTRHGDRLPLSLPERPVLTPLGSTQLYKLGSLFRQRYVIAAFDNGGGTQIRGISPFQLEQDEISIISTTDQWVVASAQAFMQGLYPPLATFTSDTSISGQILANGTKIVSPLGGYQYPDIVTASINDLNIIYVDGTSSCPEYTAAMMSYYNSSQFQTINEQSQEFYQSLRPNYLDGIFSPGSIGFFNAYYINEYLEYAYLYNETVANSLTAEQRAEARIYADDWVYAMYANVTAPRGVGTDLIRAIAGRTLSTWILSAFLESINSGGMGNKMNLLFGSFEPMVSFAALAGLTSPQNAAFYSTPDPGSSFVFELVSLVDDNDTTPYPDMSSMYVRFFYQNGTGPDSSLVAYPLFGQSPSEILTSFADFSNKMESLMIRGVDDWCNACGSLSVYCEAFNADLSNSDGSNRSNHRGLQPAVAGVIGALVTLVVAAILIGALMLLGGFRLHKRDTGKRSGLHGFKGAEKLASDQDLTIPKGSAAATVAVGDVDAPRGHERTGSWELKDQARQQEAQFSAIDRHMPSRSQRRPSFEDDDLRINPYTAPVRPHDAV